MKSGKRKKIEASSRKKKIKLPLSACDMILNSEKFKESRPKRKKKLLELINEFSKVVDYKVNIKKSVVYQQ